MTLSTSPADLHFGNQRFHRPVRNALLGTGAVLFTNAALNLLQPGYIQKELVAPATADSPHLAEKFEKSGDFLGDRQYLEAGANLSMGLGALALRQRIPKSSRRRQRLIPSAVLRMYAAFSLALMSAVFSGHAFQSASSSRAYANQLSRFYPLENFSPVQTMLAEERLPTERLGRKLLELSGLLCVGGFVAAARRQSHTRPIAGRIDPTDGTVIDVTPRDYPPPRR